jgi:S-phase kinase-associated protein 1
VYFKSDDQGDDIQEIPLPNVKSAILAKVIEFATHYQTEKMNEIEKVSLYSFTLWSSVF